MLKPDFQTEFYDFKFKELEIYFVNSTKDFFEENHKTVEYGCKIFRFHLENNTVELNKNEDLFNSMRNLFHDLLFFHYKYLEHDEDLLAEKTIKLIDKLIKETIETSFFSSIFTLSVEENDFFLKKQQKIFGKKTNRTYKLSQKFKDLFLLLKHIKNKNILYTCYMSFVNDINLTKNNGLDLLQTREDIDLFLSFLDDEDSFFKDFSSMKENLSFFDIYQQPNYSLELDNNPQYYLFYRMLEQMDDNSLNLNYEKTIAVLLKSDSTYFKNTKLIKEVYRVINKEQIKDMLKNKDSFDYLEWLSIFEITRIKKNIKEIFGLEINVSFKKSKILLEYFEEDAQMFISKLAGYNNEIFRSLLVKIANEDLFDIVEQKIVLSEDNKNFIELSFSY